jgi:hypothetical protein
MTTTVLQKVSTEDVKQAILSLIQENNVEFKQMLSDVLPTLANGVKKKKKQTKFTTATFSREKEFIPYSEMLFWKANPDIKPFDASPYSIQKEDLETLSAFFHEEGNEITDQWFEMLD